MRFDIDIRGDAQLQRALAELPQTLGRQVITKAMREAARPMLATAKANVDKIRMEAQTRKKEGDPAAGEHTIPLREGLKIRALKTPRRSGKYGVAIVTPTRAELGIPADAKGYYPAYIELGSKKAAAKPYLRQALASHRKSATAQIRREILAGLERIARER